MRRPMGKTPRTRDYWGILVAGPGGCPATIRSASQRLSSPWTEAFLLRRFLGIGRDDFIDLPVPLEEDISTLGQGLSGPWVLS